MLPLKRRRIESPTSILTYLQCPRKYYYRYIKQLEQKPNIHLITGGIAHSTIEAFHNTDMTTIGFESFFEKLRMRITKLFKEKWEEKKRDIETLNLSPEEKKGYHDKTKEMVNNFYEHHTKKIIAFKKYYNLTLLDAYEKWKPKTETELFSEKFGVRGFVDATHHFDDETMIIDYKTSKKDELDINCVFQLAIYALLYKENFGMIPSLVGIHFLRYGEKVMQTSEELLLLAKRTCNRIHRLTRRDNIERYPKKTSGLCKYKTGQCDYYETCTESKKYP